MNGKGWHIAGALAGAVLMLAPLAAQEAQPGASTMTRQEMEEFLKTAKIVKQKAASKGVTGSLRATLSDGKVTHDAHVQPIDEFKSEYKTDRGVELNFRDSYKYNIAAYKLDRILGLNMTPPSIERKVGGKTCAVTWWVDDIMMDEAERHAKKMDAPNPDAWNDQMYVVRVFDQLIYNTDRNLQNLLISHNWDLSMIDHTRAFRLHHKLANEKNLVKCDRALLQRLKQLNKDELMQQLRPWLTKAEVEAVVARRDLIVKFFDKAIAEKGEGTVLYDLHKPAAAAGKSN